MNYDILLNYDILSEASPLQSLKMLHWLCSTIVSSTAHTVIHI